MEITELLRKASDGDQAAEQDLIPLVYGELKRLAASHLKGSAHLTLNATALVHEAFLRLSAAPQPPRFEDRAHFFGIASRLMRNVIVDMVRHSRAQKRDVAVTVHLEDIGEIGDSARQSMLLDLDGALDRLAQEYPRNAKIVEMRYFAGMTLEETSAALSISVSTAQRELRFAQAWLHRELSPQ